MTEQSRYFATWLITRTVEGTWSAHPEEYSLPKAPPPLDDIVGATCDEVCRGAIAVTESFGARWTLRREAPITGYQDGWAVRNGAWT